MAPDVGHARVPSVAGPVRDRVVGRHPQLGRPIGHRHEYREIVLTVLGGTYALLYRYDGSSVLMLRVFHGRERR